MAKDVHVETKLTWLLEHDSDGWRVVEKVDGTVTATLGPFSTEDEAVEARSRRKDQVLEIARARMKEVVADARKRVAQAAKRISRRR